MRFIFLRSMMTAAKHDDRKGHHYYTTASQADAFVYSSDDPCGHHASQKSHAHLGNHASCVIFVLNLLWKGEYFVMTTTPRYAEGIQINAPITSEFAEILTPEAMDFV